MRIRSRWAALAASIRARSRPGSRITSPPTGFHLYVLRDKGTDSTTLYVDFAAFSDAVADVLGHGANIDQVGAIGIYTTLTNQISAPIASIIVD